MPRSERVPTPSESKYSRRKRLNHKKDVIDTSFVPEEIKRAISTWLTRNAQPLKSGDLAIASTVIKTILVDFDTNQTYDYLNKFGFEKYKAYQLKDQRGLPSQVTLLSFLDAEYLIMFAYLDKVLDVPKMVGDEFPMHEYTRGLNDSYPAHANIESRETFECLHSEDSDITWDEDSYNVLRLPDDNHIELKELGENFEILQRSLLNLHTSLSTHRFGILRPTAKIAELGYIRRASQQQSSLFVTLFEKVKSGFPDERTFYFVVNDERGMIKIEVYSPHIDQPKNLTLPRGMSTKDITACVSCLSQMIKIGVHFPEIEKLTVSLPKWSPELRAVKGLDYL